MLKNTYRNFVARLIRSGRFVWRRRGLWLRALLCWLIGMVFVWADREHDYDLRIKIRGPQSVDERLLLITISAEDWGQWLGSQNDHLSWLKESSYITDSFYWNAEGWERLLKTLLSYDPQIIGVTPYFGENIPRPTHNVKHSPILTNPKVMWAVQVDEEGRILPSRFAKTYSRQAGLNEFLVDRDGILRRFGFATEPIPHMAVQITKQIDKHNFTELLTRDENSPVINFRGPPGHIPHLRLTDLLRPNLSSEIFKDKIVLIGVEESGGLSYRTPVGAMNRAELTANLVDNIANNRWIQRLALWQIGILILLFVIATAWLTSNYPQFLAFFIILCINLFFITLSVWIFDTFYFWLPVMALTIVSFVTYITFLSFQLTLKEYMNLQLEKEHQFLLDVEELKNNFLSLISHDLKTPIAKIQAIVDRILAQNPSHEFASDMTALREVASELHHYIRTILQIARVESRDFRINKDSTDLNEIIEAVIHQLEPLAKNKRLQITTHLEPMFLIEVDPVLIHEVVLNLVENAIKYTPEGGQITVSSREVDDRVLFMVEDNGPGIPVSEQARVFEKFFRGESGKSQPKGSGLGLYLVKYFVELHKGKVFLDSKINVGTKVGFYLPIAESEVSTTETSATTGEDHEAEA
jgi:signal transduction histidine kinase